MPIWHLYEDGHFIMSAGAESQKARKIKRQGQAALTIVRVLSGIEIVCWDIVGVGRQGKWDCDVLSRVIGPIPVLSVLPAGWS